MINTEITLPALNNLSGTKANVAIHLKPHEIREFLLAHLDHISQY